MEQEFTHKVTAWIKIWHLLGQIWSELCWDFEIFIELTFQYNKHNTDMHFDMMQPTVFTLSLWAC